MQETAESVKEYGVLVPALARPRENGGYELIAGTAANTPVSWQDWPPCRLLSATLTGTLPPLSWWTATSSARIFFHPNAPKPTR